MKRHLLAALLALVSACGSEFAELPACDSCDDGNPCTVDVCDEGACSHGASAPGSPCADAPGFCDVGAVCRTECARRPCLSSRVEEGFGCVYEPEPSGWTCTKDGASGVCLDGECDTIPTP